MAPTTQERGDTTRAAIVSAACDLFLRQGYHGTSVRQIAAAAGIVPGAVYNHFPSKEAIHLALLREADIYSSVAAALADAAGDTPEDLIRDGARRLVAALQAHSDTIRLLFIDVLEFDGRNIASLATEAVPAMLSFSARVIAAGMGRQRFRDMRPDVMTRAFLGLFMSYFMINRFYGGITQEFPSLATDPGVVEDFIEIYLHGVMRSEIPGE